jgi:hypothetical protein
MVKGRQCSEYKSASIAVMESEIDSNLNAPPTETIKLDSTVHAALQLQLRDTLP